MALAPWSSPPELAPGASALPPEAITVRVELAAFLRLVYVERPGTGPIRFRSWPHLVELAARLQLGLSLVVLKSRQLGVTWLLAAYALWCAMYRPTAVIMVISMGQRESNEVARKVLYIYDRLPPWAREPVLKREIPHTGMARIEFAHGGRIMCLPSTAEAGRSFTASLVIVDEAAFNKFAEANYAAYKPTIDDGGQLVMVSTSKGPAGLFYTLYQAAKKGLTSMEAVFIPWWSRPSRAVRDALGQYRPNSDWWRRAKQDYIGTPAQFLHEYPSSEGEAWTAQTGLVYGMDDVTGELIFNPTFWPEGNLWDGDPVEWESCRNWYVGIDFGGGHGHPSAIDIWGEVSMGPGHPFHLHQFDEFHYRGAVTLEQILEFIGPWEARIPNGSGFSRVICGHEEKTTIATLHGMGYKAYRADTAREEGFGYTTAELISRRITHNVQTCPESIAEYQQYYWAKRKHPISGEVFDTKQAYDADGDHKDVMRYVVMWATAREVKQVNKPLPKVEFILG